MGKYANTTAEDDSSPGHEMYRPVAGAAEDSDDSRGFEGVILITYAPGKKDAETVRLCGCGCGSSMVGSKSTFRQGHDARLKGILQRAHVRGDEVTILDGGMAVTSDAMSIAATRGWQGFLLKAEGVAKADQTRAVEKANKTTGGSKSAGASLERLNLMKQAYEILKGMDRAKGPDKIEVTRENAKSIVDGTHPAFHGAERYVGQHVKIPQQNGSALEAVIVELAEGRARVEVKGKNGRKSQRVVELTSIA